MSSLVLPLFCSRAFCMSVTCCCVFITKGRVAVDGLRSCPAIEATQAANTSDINRSLFILVFLRSSKCPSREVLHRLEIIEIGWQLTSVCVLVIEPRITYREDRTLPIV